MTHLSGMSPLECDEICIAVQLRQDHLENATQARVGRGAGLGQSHQEGLVQAQQSLTDCDRRRMVGRGGVGTDTKHDCKCVCVCEGMCTYVRVCVCVCMQECVLCTCIS